jgi:predicted XRE-type DNA-binding protein
MKSNPECRSIASKIIKHHIHNSGLKCRHVAEAYKISLGYVSYLLHNTKRGDSYRAPMWAVLRVIHVAPKSILDSFGVSDEFLRDNPYPYSIDEKDILAVAIADSFNLYNKTRATEQDRNLAANIILYQTQAMGLKQKHLAKTYGLKPSYISEIAKKAKKNNCFAAPHHAVIKIIQNTPYEITNKIINQDQG